jgi:hypothetical protein
MIKVVFESYGLLADKDELFYKLFLGSQCLKKGKIAGPNLEGNTLLDEVL